LYFKCGVCTYYNLCNICCENEQIEKKQEEQKIKMDEQIKCKIFVLTSNAFHHLTHVFVEMNPSAPKDLTGVVDETGGETFCFICNNCRAAISDHGFVIAL
jgi:hypothetical protein